MAIQKINLGTAPTGAGGDTQRSANTKINENFSNPENAASRTVGTNTGNLVTAENLFEALHTDTATNFTEKENINLDNLAVGSRIYAYNHITNHPRSVYGYLAVETKSRGRGGKKYQIAYSGHENHYVSNGFYYRFHIASDNSWTDWAKIYSTGNTTKEDGTGYIIASSPVLKLQHDNITKEHEAEQLDIKVENPSPGVYKISGTTGLRDEGWNFRPPKDIHNNVLCMVEVSEENDIITVKTYKKKFDFETVSIVPNYEEPINIPDGATVMLRFNDLPVNDEVIDEPIE